MAWLRTPSPSSAHLGRPLVGESAPKAPPPAPSSYFIVWPSPCGGRMLVLAAPPANPPPLSGWFSLTVCTIDFLYFILYVVSIYINNNKNKHKNKQQQPVSDLIYCRVKDQQRDSGRIELGTVLWHLHRNHHQQVPREN